MEIDQLIKIMQASIAPCLLISGFGFLLLTMTNRLSRASDRIRLLNADIKNATEAEIQNIRQQIGVIYKRCRLLQKAVGAITLSIFLVTVNVLFLFASMTFNINLYYVIQAVFLLSLICLIFSLTTFLMDISLTLSSLKLELGRNFVLIGMCSILIGGAVIGHAEITDDPEQFRRFNPDGQKYEFVRDYLISLGYWDDNAQREQQAQQIFAADAKAEEVSSVTQYLVSNNANLRAARNLLQKYKYGKNGLMLKAVDLFTVACEEYIVLNNSERALLTDHYSALTNEEEIDKEKFMQQQEGIAYQRKDVLAKLLEASVWVSKGLIAEAPGPTGYFDRLGITQEERKKLLKKLERFPRALQEEALQEGQSFLTASISVIREKVEDPELRTLDDR